ncbi:MAG: hypothetical protein K8U57_21730 [Planctomycetes bacterium]|nr:hypothetical protein [Planctomycetota bacterium]
MSHTNPPASGPGAADDHGGMGQPSAEALRLGYEPDGYHTASVISVPVLVIVFFVLAFGTTTVLFYFFSKSVAEPTTHPMAAERNGAPLNERMKRIGTGSEVDQPRLEPLRTRTGDNRAITRPEDPNGENPPYMHPEDNRADLARFPELFRLGWADKDHKFAHVPLNDVLAGQVPNLFPVQKAGSRPLTSQHLPTAANAGRGAEHSEAELPKLPAVPEAKHAEHKEEPKKEAPKDTKEVKK